jgi:hypothetical protein
VDCLLAVWLEEGVEEETVWEARAVGGELALLNVVVICDVSTLAVSKLTAPVLGADVPTLVLEEVCDVVEAVVDVVTVAAESWTTIRKAVWRAACWVELDLVSAVFSLAAVVDAVAESVDFECVEIECVAGWEAGVKAVPPTSCKMSPMIVAGS